MLFRSIPYAGYFVDFGKKPVVIGVMAVILIGGILTYQLVKKDGQKQDDPKQKEPEKEPTQEEPK